MKYPIHLFGCDKFDAVYPVDPAMHILIIKTISKTNIPIPSSLPFLIQKGNRGCKVGNWFSSATKLILSIT